MLPKEKFHGSTKTHNVRVTPQGKIIKLWNSHVTIEDQALAQLDEVASMPFVKPYIAAMPDTHWGMGATVGSVIPTQGAVMPAAVGVDIGCGMMAVRTNVLASELYHPDNARGGFTSKRVFEAIANAVPHGRTDNGGDKDQGAWPANKIPAGVQAIYDHNFGSTSIAAFFARHPGALSRNAVRHLGTLGTGNHFIEVCTEIDNPDSKLWVVLHSGSRGFGNRLGTYFTKLAGELCKKWFIPLPNKDLGYFPVGTNEYSDYLAGVIFAQRFAWLNREIMMGHILGALGLGYDEGTQRVQIEKSRSVIEEFTVPKTIHMHHNYAQIDGGTILTRKGAVDASAGKWCIIPGSMGAKTYIARGLGSKDSFNSCSHGAGRAMSRGEALKKFTVADHAKATEGVFCDKSEGVVDETPGAYKDIDAVMESQKDLVEPVLKIKQLVCVKGLSD